MPPRFGSAGTKRHKFVNQRPLHGDGYMESPRITRIEVHHSGDEYAIAVAQQVQTHLPGSTLSQSDPVDDGESSCRVLVDGKAIASIFWLRNQRRNVQWVEMMARRLAQTVVDAFPAPGTPGFGGNAVNSIEALHWEHGIDPKDRGRGVSHDHHDVTGSSEEIDLVAGGLADQDEAHDIVISAEESK